MKYKVRYAIDGTLEYTVDANSYEEAVAKSEEIADKNDVKIRYFRPEWVATVEHLEGWGEYEFDILGQCEACSVWIINYRDYGHKTNKPWDYDCDEYGNYTCYDCWKKETPK